MKTITINEQEITIGDDLPKKLNKGVHFSKIIKYLAENLEKEHLSIYSEWATIKNVPFLKLNSIRSILAYQSGMPYKYRYNTNWKWQSRTERINTDNKDMPYIFNMWIRKVFDE